MELFSRYPSLSVCRPDIDRALALLLSCYRAGGKLLLCGNGGSAADCGHIVGELMKGFLLSRPVPSDLARRLSDADPSGPWIAEHLQRAFPALSLPAAGELISAYSNDVEPALVYAQLVYGYGRPGDLFFGISTSGNSANVVHAAVTAKAMGLATLGLTGQKESRLSQICDCTIRVPETETYKVQELHLPIYHALCAEAERVLFSDDPL